MYILCAWYLYIVQWCMICILMRQLPVSVFIYLTDIQNPIFDMPLTISQKSPSQALKEFQDRAIDCATDQRIVASHDSS